MQAIQQWWLVLVAVSVTDFENKNLKYCAINGPVWDA